MTRKKIDYGKIVDRAMRSIVRKCLQFVIDRGNKLPSNHHFYITFDLDYEGVKTSDTLKQQHGDQLTIVLQHQFWDLVVEKDFFEVTLSFGGVKENMHIPFDALISFADPSANFGLQFEDLNDDTMEEMLDEIEFSIDEMSDDELDFIIDESVKKTEEQENKKKTKKNKKSKKSKQDNNVISIDTFRKK